MPYSIRTKGSQFQVVGGSTGNKVFGTHKTKEQAREQQKALYAAESSK